MPWLHGDLVVPRASDAADAAGDLFPQGRVRTATGTTQLSDNVLGLRFAQVSPRSATGAPLLSPVLAGIGAHAVSVVPRGGALDPDPHGATVVEDLDGVLSAWLGKHGCALVRPDRYVLGTAACDDDRARWDDAIAKAIS